jgi:hypothetical protein
VSSSYCLPKPKSETGIYPSIPTTKVGYSGVI